MGLLSVRSGGIREHLLRLVGVLLVLSLTIWGFWANSQRQLELSAADAVVPLPPSRPFVHDSSPFLLASNKPLCPCASAPTCMCVILLTCAVITL